jgi:hypothetical protein
MNPTDRLPDEGQHPSTRRFDGQPETDADRAAVAATLRSTALYLDRHGWIQGAYYDQTATVFTPAACLVGAIAMVCYGGPVDAPAQHFEDPGFAEFEAAVAYLDRYLMARFDDDDGFPVVTYTFNDARGRTADEVKSALRAAAAVVFGGDDA